ncbi:MAG TPA: hypothetical protein VNL16_11990 [Chloroflexota bacterium]|nr:hypothetical protein [Chloroflexota bacterium]
MDVQQGEVTTPVGHSHFQVQLGPGAGSQLRIRTKRYSKQPTLAFPWA